MVGSCNRCGRQIYAGWRSANRRHYHPHCFTCGTNGKDERRSICDSIILSTTNLEASDLKEIYCLGCFDQYFKNQTGVLREGKELCRPVGAEMKKDEMAEGQYDSLESYITPEESLKAVNQERSPHSPHIRTPSHAKCSQKRLGRQFKESIEEVIQDADSYSERLKKATCAPTPIFLMKREDSNSDIQPGAFTSRIPRLKSLLKIPLKMTIPDPKFEPVFSNSKKTLNIERQKSMIRCADSKPPSTKMSDYLNSKGIKFNELPSRATCPMKAKHSVASFSLNVKPAFPRSMSTPPVRFGKDHYPTSQTSIKNEESISTTLEQQHPNPSLLMSTSHHAFDGPKGSTSVLRLPDPCFNAPGVSKTQLIQNQKDILSNISTRTGSRSFITLDSTKPKPRPISTNTPNVLPSCEQLMSVIMKPKTGNNSDLGPMDALISTRGEPSPGTHRSIRRKNRNQNDPLNCQICFESLTTERKSTSDKGLENSVTGCGHIFHRECISNWLGTNGNSRCPICSKFCLRESIIPVYLEANAAADQNANLSENGGLEPLLATLRSDYRDLSTKYLALVNEHCECNVTSAVTDSLRSAYEMECRNRVELQWENKRLKRQIEELRAMIRSPQGDGVLSTFQ